MSWSRFIVGYLAIIVGIVGGSFWIERRYGLPSKTGIVLGCAVLFGIAAAGWPSVIFRLVRNVGWFTLIEDDRVMRGLLAVLAVVLVAVGFLRG